MPRRAFSSPLCEHLVFKGGTSLSKACGAVRRFPEDAGLTYGIRAIAPDLTKHKRGQFGPSEPQSKQKVELQDTRTPPGLRQGKSVVCHH
ncbi:nucleotidyl transferase AbiEii/AbiGii toxin family protein [Bradyrhizobium sp. DN5]|uniref:nucleotidyl transferase AbiEii/AbiGii toxin family protein n=1 Tax=Bradyrhizobium sp. DN5 TaxID=3056950 RepID=UPI0035254CC8